MQVSGEDGIALSCHRQLKLLAHAVDRAVTGTLPPVSRKIDCLTVNNGLFFVFFLLFPSIHLSIHSSFLSFSVRSIFPLNVEDSSSTYNNISCLFEINWHEQSRTLCTVAYTCVCARDQSMRTRNTTGGLITFNFRNLFFCDVITAVGHRAIVQIRLQRRPFLTERSDCALFIHYYSLHPLRVCVFTVVQVGDNLNFLAWGGEGAVSNNSLP